MFSKTIVGSSKFLRLPVTARELYFQIGMYCDDDGFCEWYPVLQITGAKEEDLRMLNDNAFIKVFDKDVLLVMDWQENNFIRSDRYNKSKYLDIYKNEEIPLLEGVFDNGIPAVYQRDPQDRLGKDRLGKVNNIYISILDYWNEKDIIKHNPKGTAKDKLIRTINKLNEDYPEEEIKKAIDNYDTVLKDPKYFWSFKWTLQEFLKRGFDRFIDEAKPLEAFLKDRSKTSKNFVNENTDRFANY